MTPGPDAPGTRPANAVLSLLSVIYGQVAAWRRSWYAAHPEARRRLARPVISVGNLTVGGSGKTPVVAHLARLLQAHGERPAILSRGYARRVTTDGVLVVSDTTGVLAPVEMSGDEPQMLACALPGIPVLVCADRHRAGLVAEQELGCTVHLLDDGFQHHALARDIDLLLVAPDDMREPVLPAGRLREPATVASAATAIIATGAEVAGAPTGLPLFEAVLTARPPARVMPFGEPFSLVPGMPVMTLSGIARPERFVATVNGLGCRVVANQPFGDHHWFTPSEIAAAAAQALGAGAAAVVTTGKDAVRMHGVPEVQAAIAAARVPFVFVPIEVAITPEDEFLPWLLNLLAGARAEAQARLRGPRSADV